MGRVTLLVGNNPPTHTMMHHISVKNFFNDKFCSVGRVGPACSSRNLAGALVATCPGASEMPLPAGKGLKNIWHQLFEVTCLLSQLLSQPCLIYKKQTFESKT